MPSTEEGCPPPSSSTWHSTAHRRRRFNRLALSEAALLGQDSRYNDQKKAAAAFSFFFRLAVCHLPARPGDEAVCAQHFVPSSEEGSRIQLRHQKRAPRADLQYRMVLLNVMPALFITGIFSRGTRQGAGFALI